MDDKEYSNIYAIPANYTDSGKILGGMLETRNAIEALFVVATVTLIPLGVLAAMGIDGDSLLQYAGHMLTFLTSRRRLHFRRVGYKYDPRQIRKKKGGKTKKKA